jgi:hypothetical protein
MRIRIDAIVESSTLDEGDVGYILQSFLEARFDHLVDLSAYEVFNMPSYAEQEREARRAMWPSRLSFE